MPQSRPSVPFLPSVLAILLACAPALSPAAWSNIAPLPRSGNLTLPAPASSPAAFFRLRPASP